MSEYKYKTIGWKDNDIASIESVAADNTENQVQIQITKQDKSIISGPVIEGTGGIVVSKTTDSDRIGIDGSAFVHQSKDAGPLVYGRGDNKEITVAYSVSPTEGTLPLRNSAGAVQTTTPINDLDASNKKYVDDNYVQKQETSYVAFYSTNTDNPVWEASQKPSGYNAALFDGNGVLSTNAPTEDLSCTNKKYVDEADKDLRLKLTNLEQALNGYVLDTAEETYADLDSAVLKDSVTVNDSVYPIADKTRALVTRIEGKTAKMVQLLDKSKFPATSTPTAGVTVTKTDDGGLHVVGTSTSSGGRASWGITVNIEKGHKYLNLLKGNNKLTAPIVTLKTDSSKYFTIADIATSTIEGECLYGFNVVEGDYDETIYPNLFDLTAMNREDISTIEQFKAEFPELYPYENGNIYPAKISGVKFTGRNLWTCNKLKLVNLKYDNPTQVYTITGATQTSVYKLPSPIPAGKTFTISVRVLSGETKSGSNVVVGGYHRETGDPNSWQVSVTLPKGEDLTGKTFTATKKTTNTLTDFLVFADAQNSPDNLSFMVQFEAGSQATAYGPYIDPVSVTLPETYDLHGIGDYKDYLEITKNEDNELYTLKKVQVIEKVVFNGTENWHSYGNQTFTNLAYYTPLASSKFKKWTYRGSMMNLLERIPTVIIDKKGYSSGDESATLYIRLPNIATAADMKAHVLAMYEAGTPYIFYGAIETPVESVIATNLTYEQVTAIRHNNGLIEVEGNANKGYARPTVTDTVVYRLTATSKAEG